MNNFESIWKNICDHEKEIFYTKRHRPCSYKVSGNQLILLNTTRNIPRSNFERALTVDDPSPSKFQRLNLQGPSYIYAIITDPRIR